MPGYDVLWYQPPLKAKRVGRGAKEHYQNLYNSVVVVVADDVVVVLDYNLVNVDVQHDAAAHEYNDGFELDAQGMKTGQNVDHIRKVDYYNLMILKEDGDD